MSRSKDAYSKTQKTDKIPAARFGLCFEQELHVKIHDVFHVTHTTPYNDQPSDIIASAMKLLNPSPGVASEEYVVESIKKHLEVGKEYQILTAMKGSPTNDAECIPFLGFTDKDGAISSAFFEDIKKNKILPYLYENDAYSLPIPEDADKTRWGIVYQVDASRM